MAPERARALPNARNCTVIDAQIFSRSRRQVERASFLGLTPAKCPRVARARFARLESQRSCEPLVTGVAPDFRGR